MGPRAESSGPPEDWCLHVPHSGWGQLSQELCQQRGQRAQSCLPLLLMFSEAFQGPTAQAGKRGKHEQGAVTRRGWGRRWAVT